MTTDFRALCAELVDELSAYDQCDDAEEVSQHWNYTNCNELLYRARAALAAEPELAAIGEVAELVRCLHNLARADWLSDETADILIRAAELLERLQ